jgi:GT2 family glycosyltransferase
MSVAPRLSAASTLSFIVVPVHNRREVTLRCLRHLQAQGDLVWAQAVVVDDGSTDGTSEAIRAEFPGVILLRGHGDLWWAGATVLGMQEAAKRGADFIFWLNDDTFPEPGALAALRDASAASGGLAGGVCFLPGESSPAYSGQLRGRWRLGPPLSPADTTVPCDALNGNMVCISASVIGKIGYPDATGLPQVLADSDYTLRAKRAGVPVSLVGRARATGQANLTANYRSWLLSDVPVIERWRQLGRRGSHLNFSVLWRFQGRHFGAAGLVYCIALILRLALITVLRAVIPLSLLRRWYGGRSAAWQHEQRHPASR